MEFDIRHRYFYVNNVHTSMPCNANGVNIERIRTAKRNYHHGDLRAALIRAGLALLETREADDLGLREVARAVSVSAASVYRHFPDKEALLQALATEGLQRLGEVQRAASDREGGGSAGFKAAGRAYVTFALANPALFRVIFSRAEPDVAAGVHKKDDDASRLLMEFASSVAAPDEPVTARLVATQAWALVHGLAVLILDKRLPNDPDLIAGVIDRGAPAPPKRRQQD